MHTINSCIVTINEIVTCVIMLFKEIMTQQLNLPLFPTLLFFLSLQFLLLLP